jgi:hypothetical protein
MHWRHRSALRFFARADKPLTFHNTPGVGESTWKVLISKGYIVPAIDSPLPWWMVPHKITDVGRVALQAAE